MYRIGHTVGVIRNGTLRFSWITQPEMHQSEKSQCPSSRGGPEVSKTPPTCEVCLSLSQVIAHPKKQCFDFPSLIFNQNYFETFLFSLNWHNLAQNHPNFTSWGCFGNLRTSSWWWAHRFLKLMHPRLSNSWKTIMFWERPFFWFTLYITLNQSWNESFWLR